jgi:hypothetical protein
MTEGERYTARHLYMQRSQLNRDLCGTELQIREFMKDMSQKYLATQSEAESGAEAIPN